MVIAGDDEAMAMADLGIGGLIAEAPNQCGQMVSTNGKLQGVTVVMPHAFVASFGTTTKAFAIDIKLKAFVATYSHWDGAGSGEGDGEVENADLGWGGGAPANPLCGPTSVLMPLRHCSACFLVAKRMLVTL